MKLNMQKKYRKRRKLLYGTILLIVFLLGCGYVSLLGACLGAINGQQDQKVVWIKSENEKIHDSCN